MSRAEHLPDPEWVLLHGFCSMGFALPGAIAANMVYPERKILGIAGDAGFMMNVQEMETAKRLNTDLVMLVWEDHEYGLFAWKQESQLADIQI
jgi:acetolactate synthase-1/2/3 large subunit